MENQTQNAESALDSANQNNPSLRASVSERGNPPIKKNTRFTRWITTRDKSRS